MNCRHSAVSNKIAHGAMRDTGPFRGDFPRGWEGAIRVPFIVRWRAT